MTASDVRVVLMTVPDSDIGKTLAQALVEDRLAACGNVLPGVESVYRWEGAVQTDSEALVILKTTADRVDLLMERARALHPYEVPELLAIPVSEASEPYVAWVRNEVAPR